MSNEVEAKIQELHSVKKDHSKMELKIAFCYPNSYQAGMASLGLQLIYRLWNSYETIVCERSFLPIKNHVTPYTLESDKLLHEFDIIAFTMQYEDDFTNILQILERAQIPIRTTERTKEHPLILAGGPSAQSNPVPMAPFIDAFMIGDLEPVNEELISEGLLKPKSRIERMEVLDNFEWIWVPSKTEDKTVRFSPKIDIDRYFYPIKQIIPQVDPSEKWSAAFGKTFILEVVRGCNRGCSFCLTGTINKPRRNRSLKKLIELYTQGAKECKVNKISLIGSGISDYPHLEKLLEQIKNDQLLFSLPSIRADKITENLIEQLVEINQNTITTAPEAGTEELRKRICKGVTNDDILEAVTISSDKGIANLKAYFMLGLPGEQEEDIEAISELGEEMISHGKNLRQIRFSAGYFVPKPRTLYQDESVEPLKILQKKKKILQQLIAKIPRVKIDIYNPKWSRIQAILSISGDEISNPLQYAAQLGGGLGDWRRALNQHNLTIEGLIENRKSIEIYPWDFIKL